MRINVEIDQRFGRLTILDVFRQGKRRYCLCRCDCGNVKEIREDTIKSGSTVSCGCYGREARAKATRKHGLSKCSKNHHPLYTVWDSIIQRCTNPNTQYYYLYGGRGITICNEWRNDFMSFYRWAIANGYKKGKQIDRIDNNAGYFPENCRWVTAAENARNRRDNVLVEFCGKIMVLQDVANITGINRSTLYYRLKKGLPLIREFELKACKSCLSFLSKSAHKGDLSLAQPTGTEGDNQ